MLINRVRDYRKGAGLTQEDLAVLTGVSRQTIISIEKNKFVPGLDIAIKISDSLNFKKLDVYIVNKDLSSPYKIDSELVEIEILGTLGK